jgi:LmbE family N-acetylglucosaminyl deacetylase
LDLGLRRLPGKPRPLRLDRRTFPDGLRVLVLAPHPDDFDEAGLTLRRLQESGSMIRLLVCSSSANGVEDAFCEPPTDEAKAALREREQLDSLAYFGLNRAALRFLRLPVGPPGGYLLDVPASCEAVAAEAGSFRPDFVVLPHGRDTNPDHRLVFSWWRRLKRVLPEEPQALLFRDPKTIRLREDAFFAFDEADAAWKRTLLLFHRSQQARNVRTRGRGFDDRILDVNRDSAARLGLDEPYAEVFEIG